MITTTAKVRHRDSQTEIEIHVTPPDGERFAGPGMLRAERLAHATAFRVAAGIALDCPGGGLSMPHVEHIDTWAGASVALVTVEHYGDSETIAFLDGLAEAVRRAG